MFSCVRASYDMCAHAHILEGTLVQTGLHQPYCTSNVIFRACSFPQPAEFRTESCCCRGIKPSRGIRSCSGTCKVFSLKHFPHRKCPYKLVITKNVEDAKQIL